MFRAVCRSSSGAPTVFATSGLHTHAVTARSQVWVGPGQLPLKLDYGRSPHAYVNQRLQIQLGLLMMSDIPLETCWAFKVLWNSKFRYQVASCWLLLLSQTKLYFHKETVKYLHQKSPSELHFGPSEPPLCIPKGQTSYVYFILTNYQC